jgi:putative ABC transport system permease protein
MGTIWFDLKLALRTLARSHGFVAVAVTVMALGVGATTFAFIAVNGIVLSPLPYPDADELVHIELVSPDQPRGFEIGMHDLRDLAGRQQSFHSLFAYYSGTLNVSDHELPIRHDGAFVTANALQQIGVPPLLGRQFMDGEDRPGAPLVVVIGRELWRQRYNEDPDIIGRVIRVNGESATVVGVMPQDFQWPHRHQIWVPMRQDLESLARGDTVTVEAFGRLRPGVTLQQASAEFATMYAAVLADNPGWNAGATPWLKPYREEFVGDQTAAVLSAMQVATLLVLLIACANVANLMLARTSARRRELSVRTALGASRWRVVSGTLIESLLVSVAGGAIGINIARAGGAAVERYLIESGDPLPYWMSFEVDWRVAGFAFAVACAAGVAAGLAPALRAARHDVAEGLKAGGGGGSSVSAGRFTRTLVTIEIALSCALLIGGAMAVRSVVSLQFMSIGADVSGVMSGRIGLFDSQYPDEASRRQFWAQLEARMAELPGVSHVAVTTSLPAYSAGGSPYLPEGREPPADDRYPVARSVVVTPGFFETFDVPVLAGRNFHASDRAETLPVVLVNRTFAERAWPGEDAIGKHLQLGGASATQQHVTVIGVTGDVYHQSLDDPLEPALYLPLAQADARFASIAARTPGDPAALANPIREAVRAVDADLPIYWLEPAQMWVDQRRSGHRLLGVIFGLFGLAAAILASVGVYGVLAFGVAQRTREFGVRRALGADKSGIVGLVLGQGMRQLFIALPIGLVLAFGLGQILREVLAVSSTDPPSFLGVPLLIGIIVIAASLVPALRAARVQPMEALRYE